MLSYKSPLESEAIAEAKTTGPSRNTGATDPRPAARQSTTLYGAPPGSARLGVVPGSGVSAAGPTAVVPKLVGLDTPRSVPTEYVLRYSKLWGQDSICHFEQNHHRNNSSQLPFLPPPLLSFLNSATKNPEHQDAPQTSQPRARSQLAPDDRLHRHGSRHGHARGHAGSQSE